MNITSALVILTLMFRPGYEMPIYATSLVNLPWVLKQLDRKYGTADIKEPKKKNGEYAIRLILKYLSEHKQSTCEDIAKYEFENNLQTKRKLKSITDDIRKFVKNNLIHSSQLVYEDGTKKVYNKQVQTYSLSPMGILYSMHLLANFRETEVFGYAHDYVISEIDHVFIRNLVKEYSQTLPKVFGRAKLFEKIIGQDFESLIINSFLNIYEEERTGIANERFLLPDYVRTTFFFKNPNKIKTTHEFIAEQISLIFYIHLNESIQDYLFDKESDFEKLTKMDDDELKKYYENRNKNGTARYRESLKQARQKWIQIMDEDKELKKWYDTFLKDATKAKKDEYGVVSHYRKEVYSHWNFPS